MQAPQLKFSAPPQVQNGLVPHCHDHQATGHLMSLEACIVRSKGTTIASTLPHLGMRTLSRTTVAKAKQSQCAGQASSMSSPA